MATHDERGAVRVCLTRCPLPPAESGVHSLPCHIHHDGPAGIKSYFRPEKEEEDSSAMDEKKKNSAAWRAEFRGIALRGKTVALNELGMKGLLLEDAGMRHPDDEGRIWEVESHFDELTSWEVPGSGADELDLHATLQQWTAVANALHGDD
ncbi:hypothetical protein Poli38472_006629 [Pythium oligandrum]|uniref:Uncharacterized protein n=1 Tax=Pythium oligandrum TaxID=41045 RepID=A0A8K1C4X7_PYTOL|nr:hypothetical protein Poli38472_006629 [Pythium oligandrum]|eukprot:TMW56619.1 hypothetical protein Poli38472_006629 [Pythium oligandrum]